jgi:hypothetical protein
LWECVDVRFSQPRPLSCDVMQSSILWLRIISDRVLHIWLALHVVGSKSFWYLLTSHTFHSPEGCNTAANNKWSSVGLQNITL